MAVPNFLLLCLSNFISSQRYQADSRLKSTPHGQRKEKAKQRKGRIKDGRAVLFVFFLFQIVLSHNNHLTALCGLAAASDVEGETEREREGGRRGKAHAAGQLPIPYSKTQHSGGSPTTPPPFALSVRYRLRAQCQIYRKARSIQIRSNAKLSL